MNDKILEQVSTLADGELPAAESELLFTRMAGDAGLRDAWQDYHLIGDAMRNGLASTHSPGFADHVMAALDDVEQSGSKRLNTGRWLARMRPVAGLAVAASVAMVAVLSLQQPQLEGPPAEIVPTGAGSPATVPMLGARQVDFSDVESPELQNQLRGYLLNHNEHSASTPMRGLMPYVQITARDSRPVAASQDEAESAVNQDDLVNERNRKRSEPDDGSGSADQPPELRKL